MSFLELPWAEITVAIPLLGILGIWWIRNRTLATRLCLSITVAALVSALVSWTSLVRGVQAPVWSLAREMLGKELFTIDRLTAPLVPLVALLHFLTVLATARTKAARFSFTGLLVGEAIQLALFSSADPWPLIVLLCLGTVPPYVELLRRRKPTRVYVLHMVVYVALLTLGYAAVEAGIAWGSFPLLAAVLLRCGTLPAHLWVPDLIELNSFGSALLFMTPLPGVYAAVRLVLPIAPDWVLQSIGLASLATAMLAAGMASVQKEARRFFAYLFLSETSLVLVGLELHTVISLTGALSLWISAALSLGGLGLILRALEARVGRLSLMNYNGLYAQCPSLAVSFLMAGLATVGFPGTVGFVATDLLADGVVHANLLVGIGLVLTSAINGIAVLRAYFLLFAGTRHEASVPLEITVRERFAVLSLAALILVGGLVPQPGIADRHGAASAIARTRIDNRADPLDRESEAHE